MNRDTTDKICLLVGLVGLVITNVLVLKNDETISVKIDKIIRDISVLLVIFGMMNETIGEGVLTLLLLLTASLPVIPPLYYFLCSNF